MRQRRVVGFRPPPRSQSIFWYRARALLAIFLARRAVTSPWAETNTGNQRARLVVGFGTGWADLALEGRAAR